MDEELWIVLNRLDDFYVAELPGAARSARPQSRHIVCSTNLHYRRYKRFAGEALCCAPSAKPSRLQRVSQEPTCPTCLDVARRITEIPRSPEVPLPAGMMQLSLFEA